MSIVRHKKCLYNTLYIKYVGIVQRFVSTIEFFHGYHNAMQSYTLRSESDFFLGLNGGHKKKGLGGMLRNTQQQLIGNEIIR